MSNKSNSIIRVFHKTDMRLQHTGLKIVAQNGKINLKTLESNEHVIFLNNAMTKCKFYSSNGVISYYSSETGKIDLNAIEMIPRCFNPDGTVDFDKAVKESILKRLNKSATAIAKVEPEKKKKGIVRVGKKSGRDTNGTRVAH